MSESIRRFKQYFTEFGTRFVEYEGRLFHRYGPVVTTFGPAAAGLTLSRPQAQQIERAGRTEQIRFMGAVEGQAKEDAYLSGQVYLLPSYVEGMPNGLLEAMSYGLACVATPVGGIPEIIEDGVNGLMVPVGSATAVRDALESLLADPQRMNEMGRGGHRTIEQHYDWDVRARQIIGLYRKLVSGRNKAT